MVQDAGDRLHPQPEGSTEEATAPDEERAIRLRLLAALWEMPDEDVLDAGWGSAA